MPRVTRGDRTFHPDELNPITGDPLEGQEPEAELTEAELAAQKLTAMGATKSGTWWSLEVAGTEIKANGATNALAEIEAAIAELEDSEHAEGVGEPVS